MEEKPRTKRRFDFLDLLVCKEGITSARHGSARRYFRRRPDQSSLRRMAAARVVVDVHTHVYPPRYLSLLRTRTSLPRIRPGPTPTGPERLIILPDEDKTQSTSSGRPIGPEYYDINAKLSFMKRHSIDISVIRCSYSI
jgi:hypothetical protein